VINAHDRVRRLCKRWDTPKLAEPLRAYYKEPHRLQAIISMAVMAWNISLFPDEEHVHLQGMLLESLPAQAQEGDETAVVNTS